MVGKMYNIIVKDLSKLEKYGFVKKEKDIRFYWLKQTYEYKFYSGRTNKNGDLTYCIRVCDDDNKVQMMTCGGAALKVLCELYKDGVIKFEETGMSVKKRIDLKKKKIAKLKMEIKVLEKGENL